MNLLNIGLLLLTAAMDTAPASYTVAWKLDTSAPPVGVTLFPDAAHPAGFITAAGKDLIRVNAQGAIVWKIAFDKPIAALPAVGDVDAKNGAEIVVILNDGTVVCVNADGATNWIRPLNTPADSFDFAVIGEIENAPGLEVLVGLSDGWLNCLGADGTILWRFFGDKSRVGPPLIANVVGTSCNEIVYGTDNGNVYALSGHGEVLWRFSDGAPYGRSGPNAADLDGDGKVEVLITRSNTGLERCLAALDGDTGALKWRAPSEQQSYCSNSIVDLDNDGKHEVIFADKGNWVYCVNADGTERWRTQLWGRGIFFAPAVGDTNGDGRPEILVGVRDIDPAVAACAFRLGSDGAIIDRLTIGASANASPVLADLDQDGILEGIFCTSGPNAVQALRWNGGGEVQWACMRGESTNNAAAPALDAGTTGGTPWDGMVEEKIAYYGENETRLEWENPAPKDAFIEFMPFRSNPVGSEIVITPIPEFARNCTVRWNWNLPGTEVLVTARLMASGSSETLNLHAMSFTVASPDTCDDERLLSTCFRAEQSAQTHGADATLLRYRRAALDAERAALQAASPDTIARKATALRNHAKDLQALAIGLTSYWFNGGSGDFMLWQDTNPWDTFKATEVPRQMEACPTLRVRACGNEQEDIALNLLNITTEAINVRCVFNKPELDGKPAQPDPPLAKQVTLRRGVAVPGDSGQMVLDALPELDGSHTITLAPGEVSQLWLVVNTEGLAPGEHKLDLHLASLGRPMTLHTIPLTLEVLPIELPKGVYAQMNWVGIDPDTTSDAQLKDMLDHGITVAYGPNLPAIPVDKDGNPAGTVDWTHADTALQRVPDYFQCLFPAPPTPQWPEGISAPTEGPAFEQAFKTCLSAMASHLQSVGWNYERWGLYPYDEPWLTGFTLVKPLRDYCQRVKAVDPKVRMYADPAGRVLPQFLEEFKGLLDIFQPEMNLLKRDPALLKWCQDNAPTLWAYEATGPGKDLLPLGYYRSYAWIAWRLGLKGAGFWCYKYADAYWPLETTDWSVVYPAEGGVSPSRRWEATRDGQEDYRLFYVLREEIKQAREAGNTESGNRAQALLDQAIEDIIGAQLTTIDEITRQTRDYELDYTKLTDYREKIENEIRSLRTGGG